MSVGIDGRDFKTFRRSTPSSVGRPIDQSIPDLPTDDGVERRNVLKSLPSIPTDIYYQSNRIYCVVSIVCCVYHVCRKLCLVVYHIWTELLILLSLITFGTSKQQAIKVSSDGKHNKEDWSQSGKRPLPATLSLFNLVSIVENHFYAHFAGLTDPT